MFKIYRLDLLSIYQNAYARISDHIGSHMHLEIQGCMCFHARSKNALLRVIHSVTGYFVIASDILPGSICGRYDLTFSSDTLSGILFRNSIWHLF